MPCVIIKEFDYYQSQWSIVAAWMPYVATQLFRVYFHLLNSLLPSISWTCSKSCSGCHVRKLWQDNYCSNHEGHASILAHQDCKSTSRCRSSARHIDVLSHVSRIAIVVVLSLSSPSSALNLYCPRNGIPYTTATLSWTLCPDLTSKLSACEFIRQDWTACSMSKDISIIGDRWCVKPSFKN
jgi:hypothetical protein